jgi:hypothetical protein
MKTLNLLLLGLVVLVLCCPLAMAAPPTLYPVGYSPIFNKTYDNVVYNVTYRWNDNATTPATNLYFYAICAVALACIGYRIRCEFCTLLAIMFSSMAIYASYAVDFVSYGVTSTTNTLSTPLTYNYIAMSLHEVTPMPNMMVAMAVICILSVLNLYRIYMWHKAMEMEQLRSNRV